MPQNKKGLGTYLIEILVVIIGITIAFTLDNWSESKKLLKEEQQYLAGLSADINRDIEQLEVLIDSSNQLLRLTGEVFNFIYSKAPVENFTRRHVTSTYTTPYFSANNGTYLALINSGDLKVIKNFDLRQEIVALYSIEYDKVQESDDFIGELTQNRIYPYILEVVAFHPTEDRIIDSGPLSTNKSINLMGSYFNIMSARNQEYQTLIEHCKRIQKLIPSQL